MKTLFGCLFLGLLMTCSVFADSTTVSGTVLNAKGLTIRLMTYADQITYLRQTLAVDQISDDGKFTLQAGIKETCYAWIDIEFQEAEIFIQPGQRYEVEINLKNPGTSTSYYDRWGLPMKWIRDDNSRLNLYIQDFNQLYNDFLLNYAEHAGARNPNAAFETFSKAVDVRFQNTQHPYFLNYVRYKSASMQLFLRLKSRDKIGMEYLAGQLPLHENIEYMDFFHLYFEKYFLTGGKYFNYNKTDELINGNSSLQAILDTLKNDPVIPGIETRELLLLSGMKGLYQTSGFKKDRIEFLAGDLMANSSSEDIRRIAGNLLTRFRRLQPGTPAPDFLLPEVSSGKKLGLDDFRGKYLYLAFFESVNPASQAELELIREIYDDYRQKIQFVAISVDKNMDHLIKYVKSRDLPWTILHYEGRVDLLEAYDSNTFPQFILIDDQGNLRQIPAPSPSENLRALFDSI